MHSFVKKLKFAQAGSARTHDLNNDPDGGLSSAGFQRWSGTPPPTWAALSTTACASMPRLHSKVTFVELLAAAAPQCFASRHELDEASLQAAVTMLQRLMRRHVDTPSRRRDALHRRLGLAPQAAAAVGEDIPDAVAGMECRVVAAGHLSAAFGRAGHQQQQSAATYNMTILFSSMQGLMSAANSSQHIAEQAGSQIADGQVHLLQCWPIHGQSGMFS
jgi:hypothetical protein